MRPSSTTPTKRSSKVRWVFAILVLIAAGLLLAAPTLLGSKWIYDPIVKGLQKDRFDLRIQSVKLRWFSRLQFDGIEVRIAEEVLPNTNHETVSEKINAPVATIRSIRSNRSLLGYLLNGRDLGKLEIVDPRLDVALLEDTSNLERLIESITSATHSNKDHSEVDSPQTSKPKLDLDVSVRGLSVAVEPPDGGQTIMVVPPFDFDLSYRALQSEPEVIVQPATILDQVEITPELVRLGLGIAVPFLAKSAWFDGRVSLSNQEIRVPLNNPLLSRGEAVLTLHEVRSGPSEPLVVSVLDAIANIRGIEPQHELVFVDGSKVSVRVDDQKVFHTGLEAGLPRLDPRLQLSSQGSVGLNSHELDLKIEVPVPVEQLARRESVQNLGVPRLSLPIGGTIDHPEVQWKAMRGDSAALLGLIAAQLQSEAPIRGAVVEALSGLAGGDADEAIAATADFVRQLRERRAQKNAEAARSDSTEAKQPENDMGRRRPIRDALKKVLRGEP